LRTRWRGPGSRPPERAEAGGRSGFRSCAPLATYLHALDPAREIPPADALARRVRRAPFSLYRQEIWAQIAATDRLLGQLRQATYRTLIGLLAVTRMRVGEAIRLDRPDLDLGVGVVTVGAARSANHASYRCTARPSPRCASTCGCASRGARGRGRRSVDLAGRDPVDLLQRARDVPPAPSRCQATARSSACRPRVHDLRHRFAVQTLLECYRDGVDVHPGCRC
jgi:integrase